VRQVVTLLICALDLLAQPPALDHFWSGVVVSIEGNADRHEYKYTIWNGVDDAFTGVSQTRLKIRLRGKVKCAVIEPQAVYIVDGDGIVQETKYLMQMEMVRKRRLPRWFPHW
jgi:hypothetical protein